MSQDKKPIWERQGRPKPPRIKSADGFEYTQRWRRVQVYRLDGLVTWWAEERAAYEYFTTFAKAIAYADRQARR